MSAFSAPGSPSVAGSVGAANTPRQEHAHWLPAMPIRVWLAVALAVLGVLALWPADLLLWSLWTTDALKSIGVFVPWLSLLLTLRVWRALRWDVRGTWWGLAVVTATILAVHLRETAVLELVVSPSWSLTLPPLSVVAFGYASGLVLLLGGTRLWRAAAFPVSLMLLVNPVPHVFSRAVDLPLQHASALVARGLAHALGQQLTPDQLYLMFTPEFGMFIAPGCDGIRGSVTMGLLALVVGYLYQFRWRFRVALVAGAVVLGYVFNLVRLCVLVVYYVLALHWSWLQGHAEGADYGIGAVLVFCAGMLLFASIRYLAPGRDLHRPPSPIRDVGGANRHRPDPWATFWRFAALSGVLLLGAAPYARGWVLPHPPPAPEIGFPASIGSYGLVKTWPETLDTGQTIFRWAEYRNGQAGPAVALGVSPVLGAHDTLLCHVARGERWRWKGQLPLQTAEGLVSFSGAVFDDGTTASLEASTLCANGICGQWSSGRQHLGLVYSRVRLGDLTRPGSGQPVPVLLRVEIPAGPQAQAALKEALRDFTASASFGAFTYRYSER